MKFEKESTSVTKHLTCFISSPKRRGLCLTIVAYGGRDIGFGGGGTVVDVGSGFGIGMERCGIPIGDRVATGDRRGLEIIDTRHGGDTGSFRFMVDVIYVC